MSNFIELNLDSIDVGRAIRYVGMTKNMQLNMTQLNKLLYIAYGVHLVRQKQRLTAEHPAAWPYGPVFPRMNNKLKLSDAIIDIEYRSLADDIRRLLNEIVSIFGPIKANILSAWSHEPGSPWALALERSNGKWNQKLDDEDIFDYFYNFVAMENLN